MARFLILLIAAPVLLVPAGCPATEGDAGVSDDVVVVASGPGAAAKGQSVTVSASLTADVSGAAYRWVQTFGRVVTLLNADSSEASFVAPSVKDATTIGLRVDALRNGRVFGSAELTIRIEADPDYGASQDPAGDKGNEPDPFPKVKLTTSKGVIIVELNRDKAPLTVNNFLRYVDDGFYDGTIFHRVIADFVVQGGGFRPNLIEKRTRGTIRNEASNGLKNVRGSLAMARQNAPDTASSQFYFNVKDNEDLDFREGFAGYCVFGKIVQGLAVMDAIAAVETGSRNGFTDVPVDDVLLEKAERFDGVVTPDPLGDSPSTGGDRPSGGGALDPGGGR